MLGSWQELLAKAGNTQDPVGNLSQGRKHGGTGRSPQLGVGIAGLGGNLYWGWDHMGPIRTPHLGLRKCRLWVLARAHTLGQEHAGLGGSSWPGQRICRSGGGPQLGWVWVGASGNRMEACGSLSFWGSWGTKTAFAYTWRTLAARGPVSILECKTWALEPLRDQLVLVPHCKRPRESQGLALGHRASQYWSPGSRRWGVGCSGPLPGTLTFPILGLLGDD